VTITIEERLERALHEMELMVDDLADAKAKWISLDNSTKSVIAVAMKDAERAGCAAVSAQERDARASDSLRVHLDGLTEAVRDYERKRLRYDVKKLKWETWRSRMSFEKTMAGLR
jgi:hypothetical protein